MLTGTWVTQDQVVVSGRAQIKAVVLTAMGAGNADVTLYEGLDDAGRVILVTRAPAGHTQQITFGEGLPVEDGLYIKLGANVEGVLVLWAPAG